ncbi:hypothetical protein HELRODRAFT_183407 [Helobdella robusta]|uniref:Uncharacterized protein n=1 Tax=Helobdella robusta TaxID=6412 RepID=T1FJL0_HELRO|nr:hypothetical protein HELRODRAFT_183407 [Helobdella robusta]ESO11232.1 hypothetical protein HELRODRAFT_183407 [Helobdella robusta]
MAVYIIRRMRWDFVVGSLYRRDVKLPFTCFADASNKTFANISLPQCSLACDRYNGCLAFQYYESSRCDLFETWSTWIKQSLGCSLYIRAELCPPSFVYFFSSKSCYKLEVGSWNWEQARSWLLKLSSIDIFKIINFVIFDSNNNGCYDTDFYSRKIWLSGQKVDPLNISTPFVWKPFPNVSLSLGNKTFWYPDQPNAFGYPGI